MVRRARSTETWTIWPTTSCLAVTKGVTPEQAEIAETEPEFLEPVDSMCGLTATVDFCGAEMIWRVQTVETEVYWSTGQYLDLQIKMTVECSETAITAPKYLGSKGLIYAAVFAKTDRGAEAI